jgi:hypothetical protein
VKTERRFAYCLQLVCGFWRIIAFTLKIPSDLVQPGHAPSNFRMAFSIHNQPLEGLARLDLPSQMPCDGCPTTHRQRPIAPKYTGVWIDKPWPFLAPSPLMGRRLEDRVLELSRRASGLPRPSPKFAWQWTRLKTVFEACVEKQRRWENTGEPERRRCYPPSRSSSG